MRCRCWFIAVLLIGVPFSQAFAQQGPSAETLRDMTHTLQARKLLLDDPELASINIGVIVTDRVAVLWGPVPSAEVAFRAELNVRSMIELTKVRNELSVSELVQPVRTPLKVDVPPRILPDLAPPKMPREQRPVFGAPGLLTGQAKADAKKPALAASKVGPAQIKVLAPEALSPPMLGLPLPSESIEADRALTQTIRTFLQSKTSYRAVQFAVKDRHVFLKADPADADALYEAARGIAKLPNVEGVIVLDKAR